MPPAKLGVERVIGLMILLFQSLEIGGAPNATGAGAAATPAAGAEAATAIAVVVGIVFLGGLVLVST